MIEPVAAMPQIRLGAVALLPDELSTPHAAATLMTFSTTALSGSSSERNARASSTNVTSAISAIISGKLP